MALAIAAVCAGAAAPAPAADSPTVALRAPLRREAAPPLRLRDRSGVEHDLAEYRGRVVILHFWATWCVPCRIELPELDALDRRLRAQGLVVLAIAADSRAAVDEFAAEVGFGLPVLIDQYGRGLHAYGVEVLPSSYVIGRDGLIESTAAGRVDWNGPAATAALARLLALPDPRPAAGPP
ncbi:MAG: TlpA disulfide reductase family protein [Myxococcales bacterium]|nr:TlpA disulfide reductase family protein [Myxococcales bacterium]